MSRLFIIGAGFSKAIADAPLANGMIKAIWEKSRTQGEIYKHSGDWPNDRADFIRILNYFHQSVQGIIERLEKDDEHKIINKNFEEFLYSLNIEFVCSYLDLLIKHHYLPVAKDVSLSGCPIPFIDKFYKSDLEGALKFINHHMLDLLLMDNLSVKLELFNKMSDFFSEDDNFISFNYDLLVEQMLWQKGIWNPFDGYGFDFDLNGNENIPKSKTKVTKIHGSINWRTPDKLFHPNLELAIEHPYRDEPLFKGLKITKSNWDKAKYRQYPLYSHIILPTFIKSPQYNWEVKLVEDSLNYCRESDEIYILGYSVPEADYITNLLFTEMNKKSKVSIVLWDENKYPNPALELSNKLVEKYQFKRANIVHEHSKIENWIENSFQFPEYEKYLEDQKIMEKMKEVSRESNKN